MKSILWTILGITCICSQIQANQIFALQHSKDGRNFNNQISELNTTDGKQLTTIKLNDSYKFATEKLALPESHKMFFYALTDKKTATLQIIDKKDLSDIKTIKIDPIHNRVAAQYQVYRFFQLTEDQKYLLLHTGFKKNQSLTVIDIDGGLVVKQLPLSKFKNEVSVSEDDHYILINNTSRDELTLINTHNFNVAMTSNLGKYRQYGTIHNDHLYITKYRGEKQKREYWIQSLNLKSKEKVNHSEKSSAQPVFAVSKEKHQLLSLGTSEDGKSTVLTKIKGSSVTEIGTFTMKIVPEEMFIDDQFNRVLVRGKRRVATINLDNMNEYALTKLPFDTVNYLYNEKGNLLYLKEGSGSEVAVVDVKTGNLIERSGTGRQGVKFGQFMASVALAGVTGTTGYMYIAIKYSSTGLTLNQNEDKLYVINSKTNDVTHFKADDLSERKAIATGGGTFLVHQGNTSNSPLWVFSNKRINQINDQTFTLEQEIEYEDIVGIDLEKDHFIIKTESNIMTYDMKTGSVINQWPMNEASLIWSENAL